jgi:SpoVK/Ycf46/Vps4 family AAA+-type ATPase
LVGVPERLRKLERIRSGSDHQRRERVPKIVKLQVSEVLPPRRLHLLRCELHGLGEDISTKIVGFQTLSERGDLRTLVERAVDRLAKQTPLFSGADLGALVERAVDLVIDEALERDEERPLTTADLEAALDHMRPTTLEWIATARNYVEFANQGGRYDEVASFLVSREARAWKE